MLNKIKNKFFKISKSKPLTIIVAVITLVLSGLAVETIIILIFGGFPEKYTGSTWCGISIGIWVLFIGFSWVLFMLKKNFFSFKIKQSKATPHKCLIIALSEKRDFKIENGNFLYNTIALPKEKGLKELVTFCGDDKDIKWNWEMPLRAVLENKEKLEIVYLVGSKDSGTLKGSFNDLKDFEALITHYCNNVKVIQYDTAVDFTDYNELTKAFFTIKEKLTSKDKFNDGDIVIDITGGQKVTSIAGTAISINSYSLSFLYIDTNSKEAHEYNIVNEPPDF